MVRYVAFPRGVNVGGHATVRMEELRRGVERIGLADAATVKASGNLVFEAALQPGEIHRRLERLLHDLTGRDVRVFLRSRAEMDELAAHAPFGGTVPEGDTPFATFLAAPPREVPPLPFRSPHGEATVVRVFGPSVYSLCRRVGKLPGFPNAFIESWTGGPATTRGWPTVTEILARHIQGGTTVPSPSTGQS